MGQWKTLFIFPILFAFIIVSVPAIFQQEQVVETAGAGGKKVVVLDAGHGGIDPGVSNQVIVEKDVNLDVARRVEAGLKEKGYQVVLTSSKDVDKASYQDSLKQRIAVANELQVAAFVSIHVNSSDDQSHFGPQSYFGEGANQGMALAHEIQQELKKIRPTKREALVGDYYVLNNSQVPAALVELGFLTNPDEGELLAKESYRQLLAEAIVRGIYQHCGQ